MTSQSKNRGDDQSAVLREADGLLVGGDMHEAQPEAAIRLYTQAVDAGSGPAAARLAVLAAMGVARPANWEEALDRLVQAAEFSDRNAQRQLMVLADREDALPTSSLAWKKLRGDIDLERLLAPPSIRSVSMAPAILLIDGLATKAMCRWIIARGRHRLQINKILDFASGEQVLDPIRTGLGAPFGICDTDIVMTLVQERLARASRLMVHQQEPPFLLSYEPGQQYLPHFDFLDPGVASFGGQLEVMGQRVATCLTWLNDDYEGGETEFPRIGFRHRGRPGDAMLFLNVTPDHRPDPLTLHAGLAPTRGRKWLLSHWVRDRVQPIQ
ncbi:MAG TPA: 2OG-Fe(II) oxygenase [Roseiarcus sp.]|nr:2OG-Fe(II) oxygenase [Roseiarcus sp.]